MTPMTPMRLAEILASIDRGDAWDRTAVELAREVERLRALPVIAACGECPAHAEVGEEGPNGADGIGYVCGHHSDLRAAAPGDVPPAWCPLRGAR